MDGINIGNVSDEIRYRLERLRGLIPDFREKRIVIYGTGINARRVLDCMKSLNILGLMDYEHTGKYIYGKKVLSNEEIQLLGADIIIIAAVPRSAAIVYKRISSFCLVNHIDIFDLYGCDELQMYKNIREQEMNYFELDEETLKKKIFLNDAIIISFEQLLCSVIISDEGVFFKKVEKQLEKEQIFVSNFKRSRIAAKKRAEYGLIYSLKGIYSILFTLLATDERQLEKIKIIEEKLALENLAPRVKMIELLKYAISINKDVYIYSDSLYGETTVDALLRSLGISCYKKILCSRGDMFGLLGRTIRALGEKYGCNKVLYLGDDSSEYLILPQLYKINFQLIQGSLDMFFKLTELQIEPQKIAASLNNEEIVRGIFKAYDSPFVKEIDYKLYDKTVAKQIGWNEEEMATGIESFPIELLNPINEMERLLFPKVEEPVISIIIPAHNKFKYLYNCLKSVLLNTGNVHYEVIIADHGSNKFKDKLKETVSGVTIISVEKGMRVTKIYNTLAKSAKGKYLVFLNSSTQVQLNWLYPLVRCIETRIDAGIVGSKLIYSDGKLMEAGGIVWKNANLFEYGKGKNPDFPDYNYVREVDYVSSIVMLISKNLWNEIGGFDEKYFLEDFSDADLAFEVRKRGKTVLYQPDSVAIFFESISGRKCIGDEMKKCYKDNIKSFREKWNQELLENQYTEKKEVLAACERKQNKKTVVFVSEHIPTFDKDAGSRTIDFYIQEFIKRGYIVKFIPNSFTREEPYTYRLEQMGVEVLCGKYYKKMVLNWIYSNHKNIDFAFLNYPYASSKYIDAFKSLSIPVIYYGVDLHYLRMQRESILLGNQNMKEAKLFYDKEAYLIKNSDSVYYPSLVEIEIVKKEFHRKDVKQLMINIYDTDYIRNTYKPENREGIMFIGSYKHAPNVDAVTWFSYHIFPKIYDKLEIIFYIAGADMNPDVHNIDMAGINKIGELADAELQEMYNKIKMIVVPLRYGAGIKGKVIEAMYHGVPIVTTPIGMEGIPNENEAVRIENDENRFADAVIELYQSDEKLKKMSAAGQEIIKRYYSREAAWNNIAEDFR